ncbi:hypothetical protein ACFE04_000330 [Oxalis oulophora]
MAISCYVLLTPFQPIHIDGKAKPVNHNARSCYTRQRSQRFSPSKTAYFDRSSKHNGRFFREGIFASSENHGSAVGGSSSIAGGQAPSRSGDRNVKLSIKSFKVPELVIEVPATATVGSLKRSVMEAVTAALGDRLHVGVLLQGKKVRDDSKTLLQTGISRNDKQHCSLGFMLEPRNAQDFPSQCHEGPPLLPSVISHAHINGQTSPMLGPGTSNVSQVPVLMNLDSYIKTEVDLVSSQPGTSTENVILEPQPLVTAVSKEALAMVPLRRKSTRPDIVQRRIRRPFSVPEVEALVRAVEELGTGRWRDVKLCAFENVKHRTYVDLKDKWKTLVHTARISPQQRRGEPVPQELLDRVLAAHAYCYLKPNKLFAVFLCQVVLREEREELNDTVRFSVTTSRESITKPAIRRLARRGVVKRISGLIYEETRGVLKIFLENVIRDAVTCTEHARMKTVTAMDVVYALKRQGRTLYGFGG